MGGIDVGVDIEGNAGVDRDSALLDLLGKIHIGLNDQAKQLAKQNRLEQIRLASLPDHYSTSRVSQPGAGVTDLQDFGGPQPGRQWVVRLLSSVPQPIAANAAVVTWYVGQIVPTPTAGQLPSTMARWQFASALSFQSFTSDIIKVNSGEHLIAGLTGIPASSIIALNMSVNDQPSFAATKAVAFE